MEHQDFLRGKEAQQKAEYLQLKREYIAVLGKLVVAKAMLEETQSQIVDEPEQTEEVATGAWHQTQL